MDRASLLFPLPPLLADRYRILAPLGHGSIAQVVRAHDERDDREVAVKVLYPSLRDATAVATRFRREAQVVQRIQHPHVIQILDVGESDGHLYLAMELHPGGDLADWLARRGLLTPDELLTLARQLCGALEAAHRAGVIHRDVKPQNVLLGPGAAGGEIAVRLVDFGLARTADLAGLTTRTTVLGTPEYMAPEVISDGYADPRSDLYSLGVLLFEAASGELPFRGDSPFSILRQHLTAPAPRLRDVVPEIPDTWDHAVARLLAKDPLDRFASAADLLEALESPAPPDALERASSTDVASASACPRCGAMLLAAVSCCIECGAERLRLREKRRGNAVLITGPGDVADKIDGRAHVELVKLLEELPKGSVDLAKLRKHSPRLPFYLLSDLEESSAALLVDRLTALGFVARVDSRASLRAKGIRKKASKMAGRYLAIGLGSTAAMWQWLFREPLAAAIIPLLLAMPLVSTALAYRRPLVRWKRGEADEIAGVRRIASAVRDMHRREDRRLAARILVRVKTAQELGAGELAAMLAERAATAVEAITALECRTLAEDEIALTRAADADDDVERESAERALDRLREAERLRELLVADLLRSWSRLDTLCIKLARAGALSVAETLGELSEDMSDIRADIEAEEDVAALLAQGLPELMPAPSAPPGADTATRTAARNAGESS